MGVPALTRAVFLDRDGTLNESSIVDGVPVPPGSTRELTICPGAREAVDRLRDAGFLLVVVTNQPDVARGTQTRAAVEAINAAIGAALGLDDFRVCWHDDADQCACRKPKPGMLLEAAAERDIDLSRSFVIGDRWRDVGAGKAAGCRTVLIEYHGRLDPQIEPDARVRSIADAADWIIERSGA